MIHKHIESYRATAHEQMLY